MVQAKSSDSPKRQPNGFLVTLTAVLALLAKRASRLSGKPKVESTKPIRDDEDWKIELRSTPKSSPLVRPKKLLSNISNKALPFVQKKKNAYGGGEEEDVVAAEYGDGGVWQKAILMGDKCEPLDFSGAIYYDSKGKQMNEIPLRSPRASPLPGYLTRRREQKL